MKFFRGYRSVTLLSMLVCTGFFINPGADVYGLWFGIINFFGAGIVFTASLFAYFEPRKWMLATLVCALSVLTVFNAAWFIAYGVFTTTGYPLIAYDLLAVVTNLHFLGKGL